MQEKPSSQSDAVEESSEQLNSIERFPMGRHVWRQQGPYLVCRECVLHHGVYIGIDKLMIGEDEDGKPIVRDKADI